MAEVSPEEWLRSSASAIWGGTVPTTAQGQATLANGLQECADTIAALRAENERLTRELGDAHVHNEAQQRRYLQAEATAAACVGALEECGQLFHDTSHHLPDMPSECADGINLIAETLATLPARAAAMAEVVSRLHPGALSDAIKCSTSSDSSEVTLTFKTLSDAFAFQNALAAYHASTEPAPQSEIDKGMEKRT